MAYNWCKQAGHKQGWDCCQFRNPIRQRECRFFERSKYRPFCTWCDDLGWCRSHEARGDIGQYESAEDEDPLDQYRNCGIG